MHGEIATFGKCVCSLSMQLLTLVLASVGVRDSKLCWLVTSLTGNSGVSN